MIILIQEGLEKVFIFYFKSDLIMCNYLNLRASINKIWFFGKNIIEIFDQYTICLYERKKEMQFRMQAKFRINYSFTKKKFKRMILNDVL